MDTVPGKSYIPGTGKIGGYSEKLSDYREINIQVNKKNQTSAIIETTKTSNLREVPAI